MAAVMAAVAKAAAESEAEAEMARAAAAEEATARAAAVAERRAREEETEAEEERAMEVAQEMEAAAAMAQARVAEDAHHPTSPRRRRKVPVSAGCALVIITRETARGPKLDAARASEARTQTVGRATSPRQALASSLLAQRSTE